ncbi:C-terminal motor kinesin, putative [Leishmania tarentolae]|uniref:C-terminal motor kinesin, putative n=1 Tax=Leishmania tarentolae TaxID=5689 RepID=A0A640KL96_LEITA|nr:C-terminal motor kinesin, putative [Leishmania tarentolae]
MPLHKKDAFYSLRVRLLCRRCGGTHAHAPTVVRSMVEKNQQSLAESLQRLPFFHLVLLSLSLALETEQRHSRTHTRHHRHAFVEPHLHTAPAQSWQRSTRKSTPDRRNASLSSCLRHCSPATVVAAMQHNRKRERVAADEAENVGPRNTAAKRMLVAAADSSYVSPDLHIPIHLRLANMASDKGSDTKTSTPCSSMTARGAASDVTASRRVQRPHYKNSTTNRVAAASPLESIANASAHSSDSAESACSTAPHALLKRGRPQQPLRPALSRSATSSTPRSAASHPGRGRSISGIRCPVDYAAIGASPLTTASGKGGNAPSPSDPPPNASERHLWDTWRAKREQLELEVQTLTQYSEKLTEETQGVQDAIEGMLTEFDEEKQRVEVHHSATMARYQGFMNALRAREEACLAAQQRALERICTSRETVSQLRRGQEETQEAIILATDERDRLERELADANGTSAECAITLEHLQQEEDRMKDATYGLSGEVKELVLEMERLRKEKHRIDVQSMEIEMTRRELYSLCEELKGSIRVYCRVKGSTLAVALQLPRDDAACNATPVPQAARSSKPENIGTHVGEGTTATVAAPVAMPLFSRVPSRSGSLESSLSAGMLAITSTPTSIPGTAVGKTDPQRNVGGGGLHSGCSTTRSSMTTASAMADGEADVAADEGATPLFSFPDRGEADDLSNATRKAEQGELLRVLESASTTTVGGATPASAHTETPPLCTSTAQGQREGETHPPVGDGGAAAAAAVGLPYGCGRSITIHQTRSNATSTGLSSFAETFTYDKVFTGEAGQEEVYRDVEPLVRNAVDGYRVCIFAYGQTGSGKTFTMEGDVRGRPEVYGVTPRALQTILQRKAELTNEGWNYELSCTFIEIYNDVIRDLFQSGSARYESMVQQQNTATTPTSSASAYHTIKHIGDRTHITNVIERKLSNMEEFLQLYKQAVLQRSTAKTDLNDVSSRSHCIFTLYISGTNATIRQRSDGILCLVDLAGSERVNDSGVQGKQFKEAVNINRSLLDLGKCIRALRCGAVVPWRNCKLTYLLQNYLGAKGGKVLMIVTVSNAKIHALESLNSLRFAARVQETYVGTSVKRVTSM